MMQLGIYAKWKKMSENRYLLYFVLTISVLLVNRSIFTSDHISELLPGNISWNNLAIYKEKSTFKYQSRFKDIVNDQIASWKKIGGVFTETAGEKGWYKSTLNPEILKKNDSTVLFGIQEPRSASNLKGHLGTIVPLQILMTSYVPMAIIEQERGNVNPYQYFIVSLATFFNFLANIDCSKKLEETPYFNLFETLSNEYLSDKTKKQYVSLYIKIVENNDQIVYMAQHFKDSKLSLLDTKFKGRSMSPSEQAEYTAVFERKNNCPSRVKQLIIDQILEPLKEKIIKLEEEEKRKAELERTQSFKYRLPRPWTWDSLPLAVLIMIPIVYYKYYRQINPFIKNIFDKVYLKFKQGKHE